MYLVQYGHRLVRLNNGVAVAPVLRDLLPVVFGDLANLLGGAHGATVAEAPITQGLAHVGAAALLLLVFGSGVYKDLALCFLPLLVFELCLICSKLGQILLVMVEDRSQLVVVILSLNFSQDFWQFVEKVLVNFSLIGPVLILDLIKLLQVFYIGW